jgi:hypothetical protein
MKKYEYKVEHHEHFFSALNQENAQREQDWLNKQGEEGWKLSFKNSLNGSTDLYYFRRVKYPQKPISL